MPSQATVTAPVGPGGSVTAIVLIGVTELLAVPFPVSMVYIKHDKGRSEFAISGTTTFTMGPSAGNITVVISQ